MIDWVLGFEQLKKHLQKLKYTPEWAEKVTGVLASKIKQISQDYATTKPAAIFCNAGFHQQAYKCFACRLKKI